MKILVILPPLYLCLRCLITTFEAPSQKKKKKCVNVNMCVKWYQLIYQHLHRSQNSDMGQAAVQSFGVRTEKKKSSKNMNACWFPAVCLYQEPFLCILTSRTTDRRRRLGECLTLEITVCYHYRYCYFPVCLVSVRHDLVLGSLLDPLHWLSVLFFCCSIISGVRVLVCYNHFLHISNAFKTYSCSAFEFSTCLYGCRFLLLRMK